MQKTSMSELFDFLLDEKIGKTPQGDESTLIMMANKPRGTGYFLRH